MDWPAKSPRITVLWVYDVLRVAQPTSQSLAEAIAKHTWKSFWRERGWDVIPSIGLIIGVYTILRSIDMIYRPRDRFSSGGAQALVIICACFMMLVSAVCMLNLMFSGASIQSLPQQSSFATPDTNVRPTVTFSEEEKRKAREENRALENQYPSRPEGH